MAEQVGNPRRINASPTKEFFIFMITRDIPLSRAILDLVDNSVDGARRIRPDGNFDGLWVRVELDRNHFKISDSCGGIPVEVARNYAFRFGRAAGAPNTPGSIGQFGVGMKRTFFKLGQHFRVRSSTPSSRFEIDIDVERWLHAGDSENADDWHFEFSNVEENMSNVPADEVGTHIEVDRLYEAVADSFALDAFISRLKQEIGQAHSTSMDRGLAISVNGIPLRHEPLKLFVSDTLKPAYIEKEYRTDEAQAPVRLKLYAGVAERSLHEGGWYVFCNGRLVLRADQSANTVWGPAHGMRQYHPDFAYFRGYAYFDSDNAALLPWTTTKTGIDVDSPIYRNAQQLMVEASRPVLTFLTALAKESADAENGDTAARPLDAALTSSHAAQTNSIQPAPSFVSPPPRPTPPGPRMQKIQYSKPLAEVEKAKELLKARTFTAVGERTFEYFMKYEGEE